jgi:Leucine-rich repeat (LRR) protein
VLLAGDNSIAKIEHLEKLRNLRELDLSKNKIRQLEQKCFYAPSLMTTLRLDENALKQLIHIEQLDKL